MKLFGLFHSGNPRAAWRATGGAACALWDAHAMRAHDTAAKEHCLPFPAVPAPRRRWTPMKHGEMIIPRT